VCVQVRGAVKIMDDPTWLHSQLTALTAQHEGGRPEAWSIDDAPVPYIEMQKRAIIGIEIEITEIAGKWKVSQNRESADRAGVAAGLALDGNDAMATLVAKKV
jgi:transcriptional regulator